MNTGESKVNVVAAEPSSDRLTASGFSVLTEKGKQFGLDIHSPCF